MNASILEDIFNSLINAIKEGKTLEEFKKEIKPTLTKKGWYGGRSDIAVEKKEDYLNWRLKVIYETNLATSYLAGRYRQLIRNTETRPYWVYTAVLDARTRSLHRALHGKVYRHDASFWESYYPPNGWHCRCSVYSITEDEAKKRGVETDVPDFVNSEAFCPTEWRYNLGEAKWSPDWEKYSYLKQVKIRTDGGKETTALKIIKDKWMKDVESISMNKSEWDKWVSKVAGKDYKTQCYNVMITLSQNIAEETGLDTRVYVRDDRIRHSIRDSKKQAKPERIPTIDELKNVYNIIKDPDAILYNQNNSSYHLIKKIDQKIYLQVVCQKELNEAFYVKTIENVNKKYLLSYKIIWKKDK